MPTRLLPFFCALLAFLAIAAGAPLFERWRACLRPVSEACVWAKAYLPLSFALWAAAGTVAAIAVYALVRRFLRRSR